MSRNILAPYLRVGLVVGGLGKSWALALLRGAVGIPLVSLMTRLGDCEGRSRAIRSMHGGGLCVSASGMDTTDDGWSVSPSLGR